ncbi:hypothetical protein, partial [Serratia marcescens]
HSDFRSELNKIYLVLSFHAFSKKSGVEPTSISQNDQRDKTQAKLFRITQLITMGNNKLMKLTKRFCISRALFSR